MDKYIPVKYPRILLVDSKLFSGISKILRQNLHVYKDDIAQDGITSHNDAFHNLEAYHIAAYKYGRLPYSIYSGICVIHMILAFDKLVHIQITHPGENLGSVLIFSTSDIYKQILSSMDREGTVHCGKVICIDVVPLLIDKATLSRK